MASNIPVIVQGNSFSLAIPLLIYYINGDQMDLQDYTPDPTDEVSVQLKGSRRNYTYTPTIDGNIANIGLTGNELADNYSVVVSVVKADGQRLRSFRTDQFFIVESSDDLTPADIIEGLEENVIYLNTSIFVAGADGRGIVSVVKTSTSGLVDTYTITYTDNTTSTFNVTNGAQGEAGSSIASIAKTGTSGLVDTYTITLTDGSTTTFEVTNGMNGVDLGLANIVNDLTTGGATNVLSAEMGWELKKQINGNSKYYGAETDPATLTALDHVYDGYQLKVPSAGTSLANVTKVSGSNFRNARVPVAGAKYISYNSYQSGSGYGSMFVDADDIVISGKVKTSSDTNPIILNVPSNAKYFIFSYSLANEATFNHIEVFYDSDIKKNGLIREFTLIGAGDARSDTAIIKSVQRGHTYKVYIKHTDIAMDEVVSTAYYRLFGEIQKNGTKYGDYAFAVPRASDIASEYAVTIPDESGDFALRIGMRANNGAQQIFCIEDVTAIENFDIEDALTASEEDYYSYNRHDASTDVSGYLVQSTGAVSPASSMKTSDYIPVSTKGLYISGTGGAYGGTDGGYVVYNANKQKLRGSNASSNMIYTYADGDAYIRFSYRASTNNLVAVFEMNGDGVAPTLTQALQSYFPYQEQVIKNSVVNERIAKECVPDFLPAHSLCGGDVMTATLDSGTSLQISDFPNYIKNNYVISGKAYMPSGTFVSGSYIRIGLGSGVNFVVDITATQAIGKRYDSGTSSYVNNIAFTHNLNVASSPFLSFELTLNWKGGTLRLTTADGCFVQSWLISAESYVNYERYGKPYISSSITLTNVKLTATSPMFRKPIWVVGDSYVSMYDARWTYQMVHTYGIDSFLLDGLAGGTSADMYAELVKLLTFGTPRYLVWCLGMNDGYGWRFKQSAKLVEMLCRDKGIELIYTTIPYPTGSDRKEINDYIKASGYRYIDVYKAVSSDDNGTWYAGMNDDGTHPTVAGAKAIAAQVLVDFPEIASDK